MQTRQEIIEAVCTLTATDLRALGTALQEQYGANAARLLFGDDHNAPVGYPSKVSASGRFDVVLRGAGPNIIHVIKVIREFTNCGLKEAKDFADSPPCVLCSGVSAETANRFREELVNVGAIVDVREL